MEAKIQAHFRRCDPVIYSLLKKVGDIPSPEARHPRQYFRSLCSDIISQQLSGKVADVFWKRFLNLFPQRQITPSRVLALPDPALRGIGISNSKVSFLKSLAGYFVNKKIDFQNLANLSEEEVIKELTKIKGIGRWTAEMFLMFSLARPDIFSAGDQGLKNAIKKYYPKTPDPVVWSPYRTFACLILWKSLDQ